MSTSKTTKATALKSKGRRGGKRKNAGRQPTLFKETFTPFLVKLTEADQNALQTIKAARQAAGIYCSTASLIREAIQKLKD